MSKHRMVKINEVPVISFGCSTDKSKWLMIAKFGVVGWDSADQHIVSLNKSETGRTILMQDAVRLKLIGN